MGIAAYLKEIGRGKEGARSLSAEQAYDLFAKVLDRQATDLEIGAFALAMRIKGETATELQGFVQAAHDRCTRTPIPVHGHMPAGVVILPSYNGARKQPNLTALLAAHLANEGITVLVHGPLADPTRVTTAQVWQAMGWSLSLQAQDVAHCWSQGLPAFMPIGALCPTLSVLLDVRWTIGLRNPGHTVAKLLNPWAVQATTGLRVAQVVNHTHPEYALSLADYLQQSKGHALLMRGTEGEPVADARRQPRFDVFTNGERNVSLSCQPQEGTLQALPSLPDSKEAMATAHYIRSVLAGACPLPASIAKQAHCLLAMLKT